MSYPSQATLLVWRQDLTQSPQYIREGHLRGVMVKQWKAHSASFHMWCPLGSSNATGVKGGEAVKEMCLSPMSSTLP